MQLLKYIVSPAVKAVGCRRASKAWAELYINRFNQVNSSGLELMEDKNAILVEKIKNTIIEMIHYSDENMRYEFSNYLSEKLGYDYTYLANLFSSVKGVTIEKYIIHNKIERVKELLLYEDLSLKEISYKMNYSSLAHLCTQFKIMTGLTPTNYKQLAQQRKRIPLEDL